MQTHLLYRVRPFLPSSSFSPKVTLRRAFLPFPILAKALHILLSSQLPPSPSLRPPVEHTQPHSYLHFYSALFARLCLLLSPVFTLIALKHSFYIPHGLRNDSNVPLFRVGGEKLGRLLALRRLFGRLNPFPFNFFCHYSTVSRLLRYLAEGSSIHTRIQTKQ
ncbi:hypothetical protein C8F01DRAFT_639990 [Mycena amicta]|nr:hypothetical protein C8F01DRAFT_639990 [Mycena amicta]